jgi:hypothetical protein
LLREGIIGILQAKSRRTSPDARRRVRPRAQFAGIIKADVALWAKVVKDAGITAD